MRDIVTTPVPVPPAPSDPRREVPDDTQDVLDVDVPADPSKDVVAAGEVGPGRVRRPARAWRAFAAGPLWSLASLGLGAAVWQLVSTHELVNPLFLPRLSDILVNTWDMARTGVLFTHIRATLSAMLVGLLLSVGFSIPIGVLSGSVRIVERLLAPWINALNAVPRAITFMPLMVVIFGVSMESRVAIVFISATIPLVINIAAGVRTIDPLLIEMARSYGVPARRRFLTLTLPGTVPFMFSGFRLAIGHGLIGIVIAELFASTEGVGYLLARASGRYNTVDVWTMILVLAALGAVLSAASGRLERRFEAWRG